MTEEQALERELSRPYPRIERGPNGIALLALDQNVVMRIPPPEQPANMVLFLAALPDLSKRRALIVALIRAGHVQVDESILTSLDDLARASAN